MGELAVRARFGNRGPFKNSTVKISEVKPQREKVAMQRGVWLSDPVQAEQGANMPHAIVIGTNGRRHEVDFEDAEVTIEVFAGETTTA